MFKIPWKTISILIGILSVLSLYYNYWFANISSALVSVYGLVIVYFLYKEHKKSYTLLKVWLILHIPSMFYIENLGGDFIRQFPIWNAVQVLNSVNLSIPLLDLDRFLLGVNILPVFAYLFVKYLWSPDESVGSSVSIYNFRGKLNARQNSFPLKGKIINSTILDEEELWYIVELEDQFFFRGESNKFLLLKPKSTNSFELITKQIALLRIAKEGSVVGHVSTRKRDCPFVELVNVSLKKEDINESE